MNNRSEKHFCLMELVVALGLLGLAFTLFLSASGNARAMERNFTRESRAVQVLDNTIERISFEKNASVEEAKDIFEDEFARSRLIDDIDALRSSEVRDGKLRLEITRKNGKRLAAVEIRIGKAEESKQ